MFYKRDRTNGMGTRGGKKTKCGFINCHSVTITTYTYIGLEKLDLPNYVLGFFKSISFHCEQWSGISILCYFESSASPYVLTFHLLLKRKKKWNKISVPTLKLYLYYLKNIKTCPCLLYNCFFTKKGVLAALSTWIIWLWNIASRGWKNAKKLGKN